MSATLDSDDIERVALSLLENAEQRQRLERNFTQAGITNALEGALGRTRTAVAAGVISSRPDLSRI